jgi:hypothetical protein
MPAGDQPGLGSMECVAVPQGVNPLQVIKASSGRLGRVSITVAGSTSISFFDNASTASGLVLWTSPPATTVGQIFDIRMPAANGIVCAAQTGTSPAMTVGFS